MTTGTKPSHIESVHDAAIRLTRATGERWRVNADDQTIECAHGISLPQWSVLATTTSALSAIAITRHDGLRPRPLRAVRPRVLIAA